MDRRGRDTRTASHSGLRRESRPPHDRHRSPARRALHAPSRLARLDELLLERIVVLDGAMGTLIQSYTLEEGDFRGERFADHPTDVRGDNELLNLTRPDIVARDPRRLPRCRRRHHRDQHVHRECPRPEPITA